jgi:hypothetical protein
MIQYNILPSMLRSSKCLLFIRHTYQNPLCNLRLPLACHMPCQFHPPWSGEECKMKCHSVQNPPAFSYLLPLGCKYIAQHTVCEHLQPVVLPQCKKLTQRKQQAKFQSGILQFICFLVANIKPTDCAPSVSYYASELLCACSYDSLVFFPNIRLRHFKTTCWLSCCNFVIHSVAKYATCFAVIPAWCHRHVSDGEGR